MLKTTGILLAAVVIVLLTVGLGCCGIGISQGGINITTDEAFKMWQDKEAVIIDVRTPQEYKSGHIPGVALIPLDQLASRLEEVPKDQKVMLICRSGSRSSRGMALLRDHGFENVENINGGMLAWHGPVVTE